jgi:uncharacterized protein
MHKLILAAALAFAPAAAFAQATPAPATTPTAPTAAQALPDADPALWVVRDADTTIYLFGTIHMLDGRPWFNDEVRAAFDASQELVLEARLPQNPAELQPLVMQYALAAQDVPPLSERLSAEQYATLNGVVTSLGAPAGAFDRLEPWFVSISLPGIVAQQRLGLQAEHGPEMVLSAAARERGITVGELEGLEWQFQLFDGMPVEQQVTMLRRSLEGLELIDDQLAPMLAAWSTGEANGLVDMMNATLREEPELYEMLFTRRNATWADWIQQRLAQPGTVFLAVGAGHLAGDDSVRALLDARGIAAERVPHVEDPATAS